MSDERILNYGVLDGFIGDVYQQSGSQTPTIRELAEQIEHIKAQIETMRELLGDLTDLETETGATIVSAINEVKDSIDATASCIGNLETLTTENRESTVGAANELNAKKQEKLESGTNIKTIDGESILGEGDLVTDPKEKVEKNLKFDGMNDDFKSQMLKYVNEKAEPADKRNNYSTTETESGQKWTDGKPIYHKTFVQKEVPGANGATTTQIASLDDLKIETLVRIEGCAIQDNGTQNNIPAYYSPTNFKNAHIVNGTTGNKVLNLRHDEGSTARKNDVYITLYYTKETQAGGNTNG